MLRIEFVLFKYDKVSQLINHDPESTNPNIPEYVITQPNLLPTKS